ncbi:MAG: c-type cytochrome [Planctomycetes bacterium]|nr:c-type cytochrome [Planctomycetota bacterium]
MTTNRLETLLCAGAMLPVLFFAGCSGEAAAAGNPLQPPLGLADAKLIVPADDPLTAAKYELGKQLFFDPRLSETGKTSCSSCHLPEHAFTDAQQFSKKDNGGMNTRNSPTMYNVGYLPELYWDGRKKSLEDNILAAWTGQCGGKPDDVAAKLEAVAGYKTAFESAFGQKPNEDTIVRGLAAFLRGLRSGDSAYDRSAAGDKSAMSEAAQKGFELFMGKAGCQVCHQVPLFTDKLYHNAGIGMAAESPDLGRGKEDESKKGAFKTPTLREVAKTAPYFHDGSVKTLREAVETMAKGGLDNPNKDPLLMNRNLSSEEIDQLVAFLESLSGNQTFEKPKIPQ